MASPHNSDESGAHSGLSDADMDDLSIGILVTSSVGTTLELNSAAESMLGMSREAIMSAELRQVDTNLSNLARKALQSGSALTERAIRLGSGHSRFDCTFTPITFQGQAAALGELICVDWHLRVLRSENRLSEQSAMKELMRGLAHEVKNPLGGIRGAAQLLHKRLDQLELREFAEVIIAEADRLSALVDRFNRPPNAAARAKLNFHEVLERVVKLVSSDHSGTVQVSRDYDPSLPEITGCKDRLIQAVLNLALNAVQAGATQLKLRTRLERHCVVGHQTHPMGLRFDLVDNGPGVPSEISDVIFYPMVSGRADGSGLGLNQAQSVAVEHDGVITFQSEPGHTVFTLRLPYFEV